MSTPNNEDNRDQPKEIPKVIASGNPKPPTKLDSKPRANPKKVFQPAPKWNKVQGGSSLRVAHNTPLWLIQMKSNRCGQTFDGEGEMPANELGLGWEDHTEDGWQVNKELNALYNLETDTFYELDAQGQSSLAIDRPVLASPEYHPLRLVSEGVTARNDGEPNLKRHVAIKDLIKAGQALKHPVSHLNRPAGMFAVYTGVNGPAVLDYVSKHMHVKIISKLSAYKGLWSDARLEVMLQSVFTELQDEVMAHENDISNGVAFCCVVTLVLGTRVVVANIGNILTFMLQKKSPTKAASSGASSSAAVPTASSSGEKASGTALEAVPMGKVHSPDNVFERQRISKVCPAALGNKDGNAVLESEGGGFPPIYVTRALGGKGYIRNFDKPVLMREPSISFCSIDSSNHGILTLSHQVLISIGGDIMPYVQRFTDMPRATCGEIVHDAVNIKKGAAQGVCQEVLFSWLHPDAAIDPATKKIKTEDSGTSVGSGATEVLPKNIRCRHIMLRFQEMKNAQGATRTQAEAEVILRGLVPELLRDGNAAWSKLATKHSEDALTKGKGGDLWWMENKNANPMFEEVAFRLKIGQLSDITITPMGAHLIYRMA